MANIDLEFDGFSSISVTKSIDTAADEFKLDMLQTHGVKEIFAPGAYTPVNLAVGGGEPLLSGITLVTSSTLSAAGQAVSVQGASHAVALAQSTLPAIHLTNQNLYDIVNFIAQKFNLKVIAKGTLPHISQASCDTGSGAFDFLNNLCKDHNCLLYSSSDGSLVIDSQEPDLTQATVLSEEEIDRRKGPEISMTFDGSKMSQLYVAHGQVDGKDIFAQYVYKGVPFFCIKHISVQENPAQKVRWQLIRDNIESFNVTMNIAEWERPDGQYWQKGQIIKIDYPRLWLSGYFRARTIEFKLGSGERSTSLTLEKILEE